MGLAIRIPSAKAFAGSALGRVTQAPCVRGGPAARHRGRGAQGGYRQACREPDSSPFLRNAPARGRVRPPPRIVDQLLGQASTSGDYAPPPGKRGPGTASPLDLKQRRAEYRAAA